MDTDSIFTDAELVAMRERYASFKPERVSYGTVRDFADSLDNMSRLARIQGDLKDLQRPWVMKAILGSVPRGGRLIEIGAGEPTLAHLLVRAGYQVTVVDPYDGSGNGPTDVDRFRRAYPGVEFVVDRFGPGTRAIAPSSIDCCYSVSVIEHIDIALIPGIFEEIRRIGVPGVHSIHAVDHVLLGRGQEHHFRMLCQVAVSKGINPMEIGMVTECAARDVDTYFLSAESHNLWRGSVPYDEFPMRRCICVQFCTQFDR